MNDLVFGNDEHGVAFDVVDANGERWVLASQVGEALGILNIRKLVHGLKITDGLSEMKHFCTLKLQNSNGASSGNPNKLLLSYRGVIRVAMRSDGPRAAQFRDWAEDVLYREMIPGGDVLGVSPFVAGDLPGDIGRRYRQAASIVRSVMDAGKGLGVRVHDLRVQAVDAAFSGTGVRFHSLLEFVSVAQNTDADDVLAFVSDCCLLGEDFRVSPSVLYEGYVKWCGGGNGMPLGKNTFCSVLLKVCSGVRRRQVGPDRSRVFCGVSLNGLWRCEK